MNMNTAMFRFANRSLASLVAMLLVTSGPGLQAADPKADALLVGVDANYSLDMEKGGAVWRWEGKPEELFAGIARHGVTQFRVRLWTKDDGTNGKNYATEIVKRTLAAGLDPYLVIFLSDDWADMMKQPVPAAWKDLTFEQRAEAIKVYSRDIVKRFRAEGLRSQLYEIGNEIDYGICGEYPGKGTKKNPASLSRELWPRSAQLILASQAGVKEADPEAKFMLHIAHWWDAEFCEAFFRFMREQGVQIDFAGLSYFPSSNIGGSLEMEQFGATVSRVAKAINGPVIVPETAYPSTRDFKGQFSRWKYEVMGYPLTPEGQQRWLADFLAFADQHPDIHSVYYWSPEWFGEGMWKGFALFDPQGDGKPSWESFAQASWRNRQPKDPVYVEVRGDQLFAIPVREAKAQMIPVVQRLREQTGGVNMEHIRLLTETPLQVADYAVALRGALTQNLHLTLTPEAKGQPVPEGSAAIAKSMDAAKQKVVLIVRGEMTQEAEKAVALFREKGLEVNVHPRPEEGPLKFGMSGAFAQEP